MSLIRPQRWKRFIHSWSSGKPTILTMYREDETSLRRSCTLVVINCIALSHDLLSGTKRSSIAFNWITRWKNVHMHRILSLTSHESKRLQLWRGDLRGESWWDRLQNLQLCSDLVLSKILYGIGHVGKYEPTRPASAEQLRRHIRERREEVH